jgi:non-ribosomal peptide synthetase component F
MNCSSKKAMLGCLAAALALAIPAGCGGLKPTDPDQARETLSLALNAWRDGQSMNDVTSASPPITIADPSWKAGYKLTGYQVSEAARTVGFDLNIPVELSLQDPQGKAVREKVKYTVSVQPARTVIRSPF